MSLVLMDVQVAMHCTKLPFLGFITTDTPIYPEGRDDICVVRRITDDGCGENGEVIEAVYIVWKNPKTESVQYKEVENNAGDEKFFNFEICEVEITEESISIELNMLREGEKKRTKKFISPLSVLCTEL